MNINVHETDLIKRWKTRRFYFWSMIRYGMIFMFLCMVLVLDRVQPRGMTLLAAPLAILALGVHLTMLVAWKRTPKCSDAEVVREARRQVRERESQIASMTFRALMFPIAAALKITKPRDNNR
jgi:Na+/melibiose symporter-like transporter